MGHVWGNAHGTLTIRSFQRSSGRRVWSLGGMTRGNYYGMNAPLQGRAGAASEKRQVEERSES
jgi:hypothetical protein